MVSADSVTVVLNGAIVPSFSPARIVGGRIVAPLMPIVVQLALRTAYDPATRTISIDSGDIHFTVAAIYFDADVPYVELSPIVRRIGGDAVYDSPTKTFVINVLPPPVGSPIVPAPNLPARAAAAGASSGSASLPQPVYVEPTLPPGGVRTRSLLPGSVETPGPARSPGISPAPGPRRTAIPATPSQPMPAIP